MTCKKCGHDAINHFILGTTCNVVGCCCSRTQNEVAQEDAISTIHAQASLEAWTAAKEISEKEIEELRKVLHKANEALRAVEYISPLSLWGADLTKERCPLCGTPKSRGHSYDTDCLIYQALKKAE